MIEGRFTLTLSFKGAYIFDEALIAKIFEDMSRYSEGAVVVSVAYKDGLSFDSGNINSSIEAIKFHPSYINSISISSYQKLTAVFLCSINLNYIALKLSGEKELVDSISASVRNYLCSRRAEFSSLVIYNKLVSSYYFGLVILLAIYEFLWLVYFRPATLNWSLGELVILQGMLATIVLFTLLTLNKIVKFLFPRIIFNIGSGAKQYQRTLFIRNIAFVVVGIGLFVGVVGGLLTNLIQSKFH